MLLENPAPREPWRRARIPPHRPVSGRRAGVFTKGGSYGARDHARKYGFPCNAAASAQSSLQPGRPPRRPAVRASARERTTRGQRATPCLSRDHVATRSGSGLAVVADLSDFRSATFRCGDDRVLPDHRQLVVRGALRARGDRRRVPRDRHRAVRSRAAAASFGRGESVAERARSARRRGRGATRSARACCTWPSGFRRRGSRRHSAIRRAARTCAGSSGSPTRSGRCGSAIMAPRFFTTESEPRRARQGARRPGRAWASTSRPSSRAARGAWASSYSVADIYLYMLVGWQHYKPGLRHRRRRRAGALRARRCAAGDRAGARTRRPRRAAVPLPPGAARRRARRCPEGRPRDLDGGELRT